MAAPLNKKTLSERDICTKYITPALERAGWDREAQIREEVSLTQGRVIVRGKLIAKGKSKRADYILYRKPGQPIAVIEAKDNGHALGAGMVQALEYAEMLDVPFAFSSNGDDFVVSVHDLNYSSVPRPGGSGFQRGPSASQSGESLTVFLGGTFATHLSGAMGRELPKILPNELVRFAPGYSRRRVRTIALLGS